MYFNQVSQQFFLFNSLAFFKNDDLISIFLRSAYSINTANACDYDSVGSSFN